MGSEHDAAADRAAEQTPVAKILKFPKGGHARTSSGRATCIATSASFVTPGTPARAAAEQIAGQYFTGIDPARFCSLAVEMPIDSARAYEETPPKASISSATDVGAESAMSRIYRISVDNVNKISVGFTCNPPVMGEAGDRLKAARKKAGEKMGFTSAMAAAKRFGWTYSTYASHENGQTPEIPLEDAKKYARAFKTTAAWLMTGEGSPDAQNIVKLMGRIGAGGDISPDFEQVPESGLEEIETHFPMPDDAVAFEVVGASMLPRYDPGTIIVCTSGPRDVVGLIGKEVAVRTADGRRYLKILKYGSKKGRYNLESLNALPITDAKIEWIGQILCLFPAGQWQAIERGEAKRSA